MKHEILLLEDDGIQTEEVTEAITAKFPQVTIAAIRTESEFRQEFEKIAADPPKVAILDRMVRWAAPSRHMPEAEKEITRTPQKAGLRCAKMLQDDPRTAAVKIVLYSIFPKKGNGDLETLARPVLSLEKEDNWDKILNDLAASL
jgi:hypothetical protein